MKLGIIKQRVVFASKVSRHGLKDFLMNIKIQTPTCKATQTSEPGQRNNTWSLKTTSKI